MREIRQIVAPVDFNRHSDVLADYAFYMAKKLGARLTFIHVVKQLPDYSDFDAATLQQLEQNFVAHAEKKMAEFMEKIHRNGQECTGEVLYGNVADAIIQYAHDKEIDLIVISTHGAQGIEKVFVGIVADLIIKGAHCLTLVFNPFKGE